MHSWHELLWSTRRTFIVESGLPSWLLGPSLGIWVPAGVWHGGTASPGTTYSCARFAPDTCSIRWTAPTIVPVGGLLDETLRHVHREPMSPRCRWHAEQMVMELLTPLSSSAALSMPRDAYDPFAADIILADLDTNLTAELDAA